MAKRYGGRFSPGTPEDDRPVAQGAGGSFAGFAGGLFGGRPGEAGTPPRHPLRRRPGWLLAAAFPFLFAFGSGPLGLASSLAAFAVIACAVFMTRQGLQAEAEYDARRVARRPAIPRKGFGAVLFGLGLALGAVAGTGVPGAALTGIIGALLHVFAFGADPRKDKGMEGIDQFQQDRVARAVEEAESHLAAIHDTIRRTGDRRLEARVELFAATARDLFRRLEEDPRDLPSARRYLGVYLIGARDATVKFADLWTSTRDAEARARYEALLADLETNFAARTRALIEGGRDDLDIEIDVLRDRLAREGVPPSATGALTDRRFADTTLPEETAKAAPPPPPPAR